MCKALHGPTLASALAASCAPHSGFCSHTGPNPPPRQTQSSLGAFALAVSSAGNALPSDIPIAQSLIYFKSILKYFLSMASPGPVPAFRPVPP